MRSRSLSLVWWCSPWLLGPGRQQPGSNRAGPTLGRSDGPRGPSRFPSHARRLRRRPRLPATAAATPS
jgi:hypothetical protein